MLPHSNKIITDPRKFILKSRIQYSNFQICYVIAVCYSVHQAVSGRVKNI